MTPSSNSSKLASQSSQPSLASSGDSESRQLKKLKTISLMFYLPLIPEIGCYSALTISPSNSCSLVLFKAPLGPDYIKCRIIGCGFCSLYVDASGHYVVEKYFFDHGSPILSTSLPATSLITMPAIIYQAESAQMINSYPATTFKAGKPK